MKNQHSMFRHLFFNIALLLSLLSCGGSNDKDKPNMITDGSPAGDAPSRVALSGTVDLTGNGTTMLLPSDSTFTPDSSAFTTGTRFTLLQSDSQTVISITYELTNSNNKIIQVTIGVNVVDGKRVTGAGSNQWGESNQEGIEGVTYDGTKLIFSQKSFDGAFGFGDQYPLILDGTITVSPPL